MSSLGVRSRTGRRPAGSPSGRGRSSGPGRRAGLARVLGVILAGWTLAACTEDPLASPDPEDAPGRAAETLEVMVGADEMVFWRDTTFTGFGLPRQVDFVVVADDPPVVARSLVRYAQIPTTVNVDGELVDVEEFVEAEFRLVLDSALSRAAEEPLTLTARGLERRFDESSATWERARIGEPWDEPGGDLGPELGRLELDPATEEALADTLAIPMTLDPDSVLSDWRERDGGEGVAFMVEGVEAKLRVTAAFLRIEAVPVDEDTVVTTTVGEALPPLPATFIYDPLPSPGVELRVGGLPAQRFYVAFTPPDSIGGVPIRGSILSGAELVFVPLEPEMGPFRLDGSLSVTSVRVAADFTELGPKTPVGAEIEGTRFSLEPDSLAAGLEFRLPVTGLVREWLNAPEDSIPVMRVAVRGVPDAQSLGFWSFGSQKSEPAARPFLRLLLTPRTTFDVP